MQKKGRKKWGVATFIWVFIEFIPLHFIWEKIDPNYIIWKKIDPNYIPDEKPATIGIWLITLYLGCYGFASTRYENRLDRAEFKYNTFTTQLAAGVPLNYIRLLDIGSTKIPNQPSFSLAFFLSPKSTFDIFSSLNFPSKHQTYAKSENYESIEKFIQNIMIQWKHKLNNANLSNIDLRNIKLINANLEKANLGNIDLRGANLAKANLRKAFIGFANLEGASFWNVNFEKANLKSANLRRVNLTEANLEKANLTRANLTGAVLINANIKGTTFLKANLKGADFGKANLTKANFERANVEGADLRAANLSGANFWKANLKGAKFVGTNLEGANLKEADLEGTKFWEANLANTNCKGIKNLTATQLVIAKTLYKATLPPELEKEIRAMGYKHLLDKNPDEQNNSHSLDN